MRIYFFGTPKILKKVVWPTGLATGVLWMSFVMSLFVMSSSSWSWSSSSSWSWSWSWWSRARGPGRDPKKSAGPGRTQGPWAPWGPYIRGECNHLLSGKLPTVRQATYYQASYLLSGKLPTIRQAFSRMKLAPKFRIHAPKRFRIHAFNSAYILK